MAEEKKVTTKKSTPKKKTEVEEVKVEKRFCTNCGKELKEGEVCSCQEQAQAQASIAQPMINGDAVLNTIKSIWSTIINMFKKPATTIDEEVEDSGTNKSIILTVILALTYTFYLMAVVAGVESSVSDATLGLSSYVYQVNYFQIFIYGILIYAIMAIIPIVSALIVAKIARNGDFTFKKAFKLYIASNAPLVLGYFGMMLISLINVSLLNVLGTIAFAIISVFCFFNFILGFNRLTKMREDRRSYAITSVITLWVVMAIVAILVVAVTVGISFAGDALNNVSNNYNNYNDIFNW